MTSSLLSRLQSLTEPSREIDAEIALANGWTKHESLATGERYWRGPEGCVRGVGSPPRYTESLDAALTLVPSGWHAMIDWREHLDGGSYCWLHEFPQPCRRVPEAPYVISGATPAIALLIAIMKAREESKP